MGNEVDFSESLGKGKAGWGPSSADLFFAAQEHAAAAMAEIFLGTARHLRVNQQTPTEIKLDDKEALDDMALRGANVGKDSFIAIVKAEGGDYPGLARNEFFPTWFRGESL